MRATHSLLMLPVVSRLLQDYFRFLIQHLPVPSLQVFRGTVKSSWFLFVFWFFFFSFWNFFFQTVLGKVFALFWERVSLYRPDWHWIYNNPPASAFSQVPGFQAHTITLSLLKCLPSAVGWLVLQWRRQGHKELAVASLKARTTSCRLCSHLSQVDPHLTHISPRHDSSVWTKLQDHFFKISDREIP